MNYETHQIVLWIDNDEGQYKYWREWTDIVVNGKFILDYGRKKGRWWEKDDKFDYLNLITMFTDKDRCTAVLRHLLKDEWMDGCYNGADSLPEPFKTILMGAMSEVSWQEIAEYLIEGLVEGGDYPSTWDDEG